MSPAAALPAEPGGGPSGGISPREVCGDAGVTSGSDNPASTRAAPFQTHKHRTMAGVRGGA